MLLSNRISSKVLFSSTFWGIVSVKLFLPVGLGWVCGLYGSSWLLLKKKIFLRKRDWHPNQLVNFQERILQLLFTMLCSALYSYEDTGSRRLQATTVWISRKAKSSCFVFCLFGVFFYVWRHVELQGKARSETSFFLGRNPDAVGFHPNAKILTLRVKKKCHQYVASWILHFFNRSQFP